MFFWSSPLLPIVFRAQNRSETMLFWTLKVRENIWEIDLKKVRFFGCQNAEFAFWHLKKHKKTRFFAHFFESKFELKFRWFRAQKNAFFWWKNAKTQKNTFFRDFFAHFLSTEISNIFPYFWTQKNEQKKCPKKWKKRVFLCFFQQ